MHANRSVDMISRFLASLAAGLLLGNILSEAARTGLGVLMQDRIDPTLWLGPSHPDSLTLLMLLATWLLAATSAAAMASALSGTAVAGWLCALAWTLAMLLTGGLSGTEAPTLTLALGMVLLGTLLGNRIASESADPNE